MATGFQIFQEILSLLKKFKEILAITCLNITFSTIFLVHNGHRAIKVQCCRASGPQIEDLDSYLLGLITKQINENISRLHYLIL